MSVNSFFFVRKDLISTILIVRKEYKKNNHLKNAFSQTHYTIKEKLVIGHICSFTLDILNLGKFF